METISIMDGLILTIVSMLVVFLVLAAIWGFVELTGRLINRQETASSQSAAKPITPSFTKKPDSLIPNKKYQQVAEIMALVLASEDEPNKKFEIVKTKRVK